MYVWLTWREWTTMEMVSAMATAQVDGDVVLIKDTLVRCDD